MAKKIIVEPTEIVVGQDLPAAEVRRLTRISKAYTKKVNAERIVWPDPDDIDSQDEGDGNPLTDFVEKPEGFLSNKLGVLMRAHGKNKKGKRGGGKPSLPNPQVVLQEVQATFKGFPQAGNTGNLVIGEFNGEFLDAGKAKYFRDTYEEIFKHFHVVFLEEVDCGGVTAIAGFLGYQGYCSTANTRNQAVAFLVHPRLKVIGNPIEHMGVATVQGIPDLRPAFELRLEDTTTGDKFSVIVVHLKSMRGGPQATAAVRYKQLDILQKALGSKWAGIIGGDFNYKLDDTSLNDGDPLKNNGYSLFMPNDKTPTQSMGSRIDGFFTKGLAKPVGFYQVRQLFRNPKITRAFSDHAVLNFQIIQSGKADDGKGPVDIVTFVMPEVKLLGFAPVPVTK